MRLFLIFLFAATLMHAECCTCTQKYSDLSSALEQAAVPIGAAYAAQMAETKELKRLLARSMLLLSYEKQRSEVFSIAKNVDSAGFATTIEKVRAERLNLDAETAKAMSNGYAISNTDAEAITMEAK